MLHKTTGLVKKALFYEKKLTFYKLHSCKNTGFFLQKYICVKKILLCKNPAFLKVYSCKKPCFFTKTYFVKRLHFYVTESCFFTTK